MAETIDALVHRNLMDVFGQRDPALRARAIAEAYAPDVTFTDTDGVIAGPEALGRKAQERLDGAPDFVFRPAGPARHVGDMGLLAWAFGPEGKPPVVTGATGEGSTRSAGPPRRAATSSTGRAG